MKRYLVGLTGGLASGKSTVAKWFGQAGFHVVDADRVQHDGVQLALVADIHADQGICDGFIHVSHGVIDAFTHPGITPVAKANGVSRTERTVDRTQLWQLAGECCGILGHLPGVMRRELSPLSCGFRLFTF